MTSSEQLGDLFAALSAAQGEMKPALKDRVGQVGQGKVRYADLASIWDACRAPLAKHELCVIQLVTADANLVTVRTILGHASGQWIAGSLTVVADDDSLKGVGSARTYACRYALASVVGVVTEDDPAVAVEAAAVAAQRSEREKKVAEIKKKKGAPAASITISAEVAVPANGIPEKGAPHPAQLANGKPIDPRPPVSLDRLAELRAALFERTKPEDPAMAWNVVLSQFGVTSARDLDLAGLTKLTQEVEGQISALDLEQTFHGAECVADAAPKADD